MNATRQQIARLTGQTWRAPVILKNYWEAVSNAAGILFPGCAWITNGHFIVQIAWDKKARHARTDATGRQPAIGAYRNAVRKIQLVLPTGEAGWMSADRIQLLSAAVVLIK
jgi:hypothetical protein